MSDFSSSIGKRIVSLRKSKGMTQAELAGICGKHAQSLERVENGKVIPSLKYLKVIAKALEVPVTAFIKD